MPSSDPAKRRAQAAKWREANRERIAAERRRWTSEHPEKIREYAARFKRSHPDYHREYREAHAKPRTDRKRWNSSTRINDDPSDPRHGTTNGYGNLKCRCDRCREANRIKHAEYMNNRRPKGSPVTTIEQEIAQDIRAMKSASRLSTALGIRRAMKAVGHWTPEAETAFEIVWGQDDTPS